MLNVTAAASKSVRSIGVAASSGHSARGSSAATTARGSVAVARAANKNDLVGATTVESTRRAALSVGLGASLAAVFPKTAFALLPDDDDEELIRRAKERRQNTLKQELAKEKNFIGLSKPTEAEISTVQLAVAKLVKTGSLLEQGNTDAASAVIGDQSSSWAADLTALAKKKSAGAAQKPAGQLISSLSNLQAAAQNAQAREAKVSLASTARAMEDFVSAVGMKDAVKGL